MGTILIPTTTAFADFNWQTQLQTNPNQYWETYNNKPTIQHVHNGNEISYYIDALPTNRYAKVWQYAINQYNNLHVIKLVPTVKSKAQIKLYGTYSFNKAEKYSDYTMPKGDLDGNYGITYNVSHDNGTQDSNSYFSNTKCVLSVAMAFYDQPKLERTVAEHELGHALGFAHNPNLVNGHHVVMNSWTDSDPDSKTFPTGLGAYEQQALMNHYQSSIK